MAQIKILGSSSAGNCYLLECKNEILIIEAGIHPKEVKKALNFDLSKVSGVICTHEHQDHAKHLNDFKNAYIEIFASKGTLEACFVEGNIIKEREIKNIGGFKVMALPSVHNAAEPLNYIIEHEDIGRLLFLTDTALFNYIIPGINHFLIEANYCSNIVLERLFDNPDKAKYLNRLEDSHMSIDMAKMVIKNNLSSDAKTITLIHLSDGNSDAKRFVKEVQSLSGIPTYVADRGVIINLQN